VTSTLLLLQHIACEPPAAFEDELLSRGLELERVELDEGEPLPHPRDFAATIVMGGPMGTYDAATHPWRGCLGAQVLAGALGARVYPGEEAEVGVLAGGADRGRRRRPRLR
jgi:GMP synthase (glutamine-hydrolysing)